MEEKKLRIFDGREMILKWTTKTEVYKELTIACGVYLPLIDQTNYDYVRDILCRGKFVSTSFYTAVHRIK